MSSLLETFNNGFLPHGHCFFWIPSLLWMFVVSDGGIALAYFLIPFGIYKVIKLSNLEKNRHIVRVFYLFVVFILACGTTHLIKVITIWYPIYWISAYINMLTMVVSLTAATILLRTINEASQYINNKLELEQELDLINTKLEKARGLFKYQNKAIEFLNQTNDLLETCTNEKEFAEIIIATAQQLTNAKAGILYLIKDDVSYAELMASWGEVGTDSAVLDLDKCWAYRQHNVFPNSEIESNLSCKIAFLDGVDHVCYPLVGGGQILGLLQLRGVKNLENEYAGMHMTVLAKRAGFELMNLHQRENLISLSIKDSLTGLYNRRYLEDAAEKELKRTGRSKKKFSLIMLDIDNFKNINDTHGHSVGDEVLVNASATIKKSIRDQDVACRYGGEEFVVLLPETGDKGALSCAKKIRKNVEGSFIYSGTNAKVSITISSGIATYPDHGENIDDIIKNADNALYVAKRSGKNKAILYKRT